MQIAKRQIKRCPKRLGLDRPRGVRVQSGGKKAAPVKQQGIKQNDVILSVDGDETDASNQLEGLIRYAPRGR